jgi:hypothetical protein
MRPHTFKTVHVLVRYVPKIFTSRFQQFRCKVALPRSETPVWLLPKYFRFIDLTYDSILLHETNRLDYNQ